MSELTLRLHQEKFSIHRLASTSSIPSDVFQATIYFIAKTADELSIVVPENIAINSQSSEHNWHALEVVGPLDFSLTGILAKISTLLAHEKISIFAISTFDTDYVLVKGDKVGSAIKALALNNYQIINKI